MANIEYTAIYCEQVNEPIADRHGQYYRLTLYESNKFDTPFLLKVEWGERMAEDFDRAWELLEMPNKPQAIRKVIQLIDAYEFPERGEDATPPK